MALTYLNNTRATNNLWLTPKSAIYDSNLAVSQTVTGGFPALYHNQHYLVNGSVLLTNNGYQLYSQASVFANLTLAANQIGNSINLTNVSENVSVAFINYNGGAASTILGTGTAYGNQNVIFFNTNTAIKDAAGNQINSNLSLGTWGGFIAMHEQLHVLGLANNGTGDHGVLVADLRNTIMQYPLGGYATTTAKIPLTPGMQDIQDLQFGNVAKGIKALGVSTTSNGNDTYTFTDTSIHFTASTATATQGGELSVLGIPNRYVMTIWDGNGIDTITAAGTGTSNYINLNAGQFSSIGYNRSAAPTGVIGSAGYGVEYNVGIAIGATIENATGGFNPDTLIGNAQANVLKGDRGEDSINGGAGADSLFGGSGSDKLTGDIGADRFVFDEYLPVAFTNTVFGVIINNIDRDVITDFSRVQGDKIDLSIIDAITTNIAGSNDIFHFLNSSNLLNGDAGRLISKTATVDGAAGAMLLGDVNGDAVADFNIFLVGVTASTMLASDFIL